MRKIKILAGVAVLMTSLAIMPAVSQAQEQVAGSGLSISPTRTDLVVNEGTAADLNISIKNVTGGKAVAKAFINDFEPDGVTGEPRLITDSNVKSSSSIRDFIVGLEDVPLDVDETKDLKMQVDIPVGASPGAYYGVIRYQAVPVENDSTDGGGQVALTASVGSIVLVEVPGNIVNKIEIKKVSAYLGDKSGSIFTKKPDQVGVEIENLGNGFARPFGQVKISGMFSGDSYEYELNNTNPRGVVLPDSTRIYKDPVENINKPGRYTITAFISHTNGGEAYTITSTFWYLPAWFLTTLFVLVLLLAWLAFYLYRKYVTKSTKRRRR